jgi:hypothetical protein
MSASATGRAHPTSIPMQPDDVHALRAKPVNKAAGRYACQRSDNRAGGHHESETCGVEPERTREIERADYQSRHHYGCDQCTHGKARAEHRLGNIVNRTSGDAAFVSVNVNKPPPNAANQQSYVEQAESCRVLASWPSA